MRISFENYLDAYVPCFVPEGSSDADKRLDPADTQREVA